jgi:hypothetical protein
MSLGNTKLKGKPGHFTGQDFTATQFASAADKAAFTNKMTRFILGGFQQGSFHKKMYQHLSNMFGHIAHYNIHGFYCEWFEDIDKCFRWVENMANNWLVGIGDPKYTWSDVEKALVQWIKDNQIAMQLDELNRAEERAGDLALLQRLQEKYAMEDISAMDPPVEIVVEIDPVSAKIEAAQMSLF